MFLGHLIFEGDEYSWNYDRKYSIIPQTKTATSVKAGTKNRESRWLQNSRQGMFLGHLILEEVGYS